MALGCTTSRPALQLLGLLCWWVVLYGVKGELTNLVNGSEEERHPHTSTFQATHLPGLTEEDIEKLYSIEVENCWDDFSHLMNRLASRNWCNWTVISSPYNSLQICLEDMAERRGYYYPNIYAEFYIMKGHKTYFSNCTSRYLIDPPEDILLPIIFAPICIIPFMVTLVVWKSKNGKPQV